MLLHDLDDGLRPVEGNYHILIIVFFLFSIYNLLFLLRLLLLLLLALLLCRGRLLLLLPGIDLLDRVGVSINSHGSLLMKLTSACYAQSSDRGRTRYVIITITT